MDIGAVLSISNLAVVEEMTEELIKWTEGSN